MSPIALIEGLLFMSGEEGLNLQQCVLATSLSTLEVQQALEALTIRYQDDEHGFSLENFGGRYKFITKQAIYPVASAFFGRQEEGTLSQAALETLAIIAYRQPITRVEIEEIRGVSCELMLKKLQARNLIEISGQLDVVGKPNLYQVTSEFLDAFSLTSLAQLPELPNTQQDTLFD